VSRVYTAAVLARRSPSSIKGAFEEARTRLLFGEHLRRLKGRAEARTQLRSALEIFERLGAAPRRTRTVRTPCDRGDGSEEGPGTLDQLTPQELQIVRRVAEGATNKEVAAQLFISPRTVAYHLRNVFVNSASPPAPSSSASRAPQFRQDEIHPVRTLSPTTAWALMP
jgi:ATP/maltotriose-dependent transcriptional regulator MalT